MEISVLTALNQGLMWGILAIGVFVSFKVLDFADMTCEGSIALGGAITAVTLQAGLHPILAVLFALLGGAGAGLITGLLHTKLRIPPILSGILTMTALYSINLRIMKDRASITMLNVKTLTSGLTDALVNSGLAYKYSVQMSNMIIALIFVALVIGAIYWFFGTEFGCTIRATGMNPKMCRAQGINTNTTIIVGLMISNALIALAGCLISQMQFNTTVSMGTGAIVIGLASIIIGEALTGKKFSFWARLTMLNVKTLTSGLTDALVNSGLAYKYSVQMSNMIIALIFVALVIGAIYWFFGTEFGCTIRATGMNPKMCRAQGINTNTTIIVGLMISNALIALAGCLISQMQFNTTVSMGTGAIVIGLASIIIGEALTGKKFSFWARLIMLIVGSILYRLVITMVLMIPGFNTNDLKLLTAIVVAVALAIPAIKGGAKPLIQKFIGKKGGNENA